MDVEKFINEHDFQVWATLALIAVLYIIRFVVGRIILRRIKHLEFSRERRVMIVKVVGLLLFITFSVVMLAIWGVEPDDLLLFVSSLGTVLGVAFFAQWSILSNITASLILFFNHPVRIGCYIKILDKDNPVEGNVLDITSFFIKVRDVSGNDIMVPTAVVLQKSISLDENNNKSQASEI